MGTSTQPKPQTVDRAVVDAFYAAQASRDAARIAPFLADDVQWLISGPVELLGFCGQWRGKKAALELFDRQVPRVFHVTGFDTEEMLIDGNGVATLNRVTAVAPGGERIIRYGVAQFVWFRDGKVARVHSVLDSFDAAEQVLGHRINLTAGEQRRNVAENLFAV